MLTYRTGAAGAPSAARSMSEHLLQQTLPPEMAAMADYYEQGTTPPTCAEAAASRYAGRPGTALEDATLDEVLTQEIDRLRDVAAKPDVELALQAAASLVAAKLVSPETALAWLSKHELDVTTDALDAAALRASGERDYSSAVASPRRDMNPALAERLGIVPGRALTPGEIAYLLNGQRADGKEIEGKKKQTATQSLRTLFGFARDRLPTVAELEHVLAGCRIDGTSLPAAEAERAVHRFLTTFGVKDKTLDETQRAHLLAGLSADGAPLSQRAYQARLDTAKARIGYVDLTFSAPKSVSIAWAFAPTEAERAIIRGAHRDAVDAVMREIERQIGRARKGQGGRDGSEPGAIGWVSFDHYAARPTVAVVRDRPDGGQETELYTLKDSGARVPGDMQLHTHTAVFNVVLTESGHVGGLDLARLEGRIKEWGALYQAYLVTNLRAYGVDMALDRRTEMARLMDVPERVREHFSKRTLSGTAAARAYAAAQGLDWDSLDADRKVGLLKSSVQAPREAKSDDISDLTAWTKMAAEIGYHHKSVLRPDEATPLADLEERLNIAYQAAMPVLDKQLQRRAVIDGADIRVAAAKGLIASGVRSAEDVDQITQAFRTRGVHQNGDTTALIWGKVYGEDRRERVAVTTALHAREETSLIERAKAAAADQSAALTSTTIDAAIKALPDLDFTSEHGLAQRAIIDRLGQGGRLGVAIGVAGAGKSTLLKPLVRAWREDGRTVHGIALAWRQSDDLGDAGIPATHTRAVESFLRGAARGILALDKSNVVVVDEVGLLGTRQLNEILKLQEEKGFQLIALGDPKQMQAVEAGPVIGLLQRALGSGAVPELGHSVRQQSELERETVLMFRNSQTADAIARKHADGTLRIVPGGYDEAITHIVDLWQERRMTNAERRNFTLTISAPTNADAHAISLAIRARRQALGEIGEDRITVPACDAGSEETRTFDLALAVGDKVRLFRRTNAQFDAARPVGSNIGRNGTVLEIRGIDENGLVLRAPSGKQGLVPWDRLKAPGSERILLDYGEALTTNTAQGSTVSEHIHAMPAGSTLVSAFGAYTSGSRHRDKSFIVTSEGAERVEVAGRRPLGDARKIEEADLIANIVRNLSRQPVKEASLDLLERARDVRRGAVRAFQAGVQPFEARRNTDIPISGIHEKLRLHAMTAALTRAVPDLVQRLTATATRLRHISHQAARLSAKVTYLAAARRKQQPNPYWTQMSAQHLDADLQAPPPTRDATQRKGRTL
jgi:hypothetical protein